MNADRFWERFTDYNYDYEEAYHDTWAFSSVGKTADKLVALVLAKIKTATSSLYAAYEKDGKPLPKAGDCAVILNSRGEPECIIAIKSVEAMPFKEVGAEHAEREGEGDQSLQHWRRTHEEAFRAECERCGFEFSEDIMVLCEEFELVFQ